MRITDLAEDTETDRGTEDTETDRGTEDNVEGTTEDLHDEMPFPIENLIKLNMIA